MITPYQAKAGASLAGSSTSGNTWTKLGPNPIFAGTGGDYSGRINSIAINSSNPMNIYIGAASGGVWKTLDGGTSWTPLTDMEPRLSIGAMTISPDGKTLYVGTGDSNHGANTYYGAGLLKSTDGGQTWTILGSDVFGGRGISGVVVNPSNPSRLLVSTTWASCCKILAPKLDYSIENQSGLGVYLSTDGGSTWTLTLPPSSFTSNQGVADLLVDPASSSVIYAGDFGGAVWKSADGGATWSRLISFSSTASWGRVAVAATPALPGTVFAAISNHTYGWYGIYRYDTSLHQLNSPPHACAAGLCNYVFVLAVDTSNSNVIYFGDTDLYKSSDGGQTWVDLGGLHSTAPGAFHVDQHALALLPGSSPTIFLGNDGGLYKSNDGGTTWTNLNTGLGITEFYYIAVSPTSKYQVLGGTQDNGCVGYSGQPTWTALLGGDGGWTGIEANSPNIMYCYSSYSFYKSTDGGATWKPATTGINQSDGRSLILAVAAQNPSNPGTLYLGTIRVYRTTDYANTWSDASGVLGSAIINAIEVALSNSSILYLGDSSGSVKVSMNSGRTWQTIATQSAAVVSLAVQPTNTYSVYVAFQKAGLFHISYQGSSWQSTRLSFPSVRINIVRANPTSNELYVGTDSGVFYSKDGGSSWQLVGEGLPNSPVYDLAITPSNQLFAATFGRGVWMIDMTKVVFTTTTSTTTSTTTTATTTTPTMTTSTTSSTLSTTTSSSATTSSTTATGTSTSKTTSTTTAIPEFPNVGLALLLTVVVFAVALLFTRRRGKDALKTSSASHRARS